MPDMIALPRLPSRLIQQGYTNVPGYRRMYVLANDGALPVEIRNGRIYIKAADLPAIAARLGLTIGAAQ